MPNADEFDRRSLRRIIVAVVVVFAFLSPGCNSWHTFKERTTSLRGQLFDSAYEDKHAHEKFEKAQALYKEGKYDKARTIFREVADNTMNPTDLAENARFMQAECRYALKQYPEAADTYHKLLLDFPTGAHRRESAAKMYEIADFWLDDFQRELERRADEKGVLRWRPHWPNPMDRSKPMIDQEGRMLEAFERVHTQDFTGPDSDKAIFWCGYINFVRGNFQEADHFFSQLVELHKESPLRPQALSYAIQAKNNATGGPDYDGRKCAEALQLVYTAEASVPEVTQNPELAAKLARAKAAIRAQQAEKDFRTAEYYQRTGHPGSAIFYYELVRRRYGGTKHADLADERKEHLMALMREGKPTPGNDPFAIAAAKWKEVFNSPKSGVVQAEGQEPAKNDSKHDPKLGPPSPVSVGAPGSSPYDLGPVDRR